MSALTRATALVFGLACLACTGGEAPPPPSNPLGAPVEAPAPVAEDPLQTPPAPVVAPALDGDAAGSPDDAGSADDGSAPDAAADTEAEAVYDPLPAGTEAPADGWWCCQYDGDEGTVQDLLDSPKACSDKYPTKNATFLSSPACAPVCCKLPKDAADLSAGYAYSTLTTGTCDVRGGAIEADLQKCAPVRRKRTVPSSSSFAPGRHARPPTAPAPEPDGRGKRPFRPR